MPMNYSEMEQELRSLREKMTSNEAKLEERSRLEDRIYKIFTVTISIFGLFLGYIMWNSNRVQSDLVNKVDTARNSLEQQYNTALTKQGDEFQTLKNRLWQEQNASYVSAFIKFADMRQNLLDLEGALMSAIVAFIKATEGGFRDREAMLVRMDTAIRRATIAQKRLPEMLLSEVQKAVESVEQTNGRSTDQTIKLKETLKSHRETLNP